MYNITLYSYNENLGKDIQQFLPNYFLVQTINPNSKTNKPTDLIVIDMDFEEAPKAIELCVQLRKENEFTDILIVSERPLDINELGILLNLRISGYVGADDTPKKIPATEIAKKIVNICEPYSVTTKNFLENETTTK